MITYHCKCGAKRKTRIDVPMIECLDCNDYMFREGYQPKLVRPSIRYGVGSYKKDRIGASWHLELRPMD